jgi:tRNA threonylcarbamoyladenosine biosynthesis protein TsaB
MMHGQAEALFPMVNDVVREAGLTPSALDAVAVTTGPGSFTGIRVGIAAARGIALAVDRPLIGVTSFEAVTKTLSSEARAGRCLLVALESRRADLYVQFFDRAGYPLSEPAAVLPEALSAAVGAVTADPIVVVGDAAIRAASALDERCEATIVEMASPPVTGVVRATLGCWRHGEVKAPVRPLYVRPPNVTVAKDSPPLLTR